jgi:hypothetical protein
VVRSYDVALTRKEKGRTVNRGEKGPGARESPQRVEEEPEGLDLGPLQGEAQDDVQRPRDGGCSLAELLRSLRMRTLRAVSGILCES